MSEEEQRERKDGAIEGEVAGEGVLDGLKLGGIGGELSDLQWGWGGAKRRIEG